MNIRKRTSKIFGLGIALVLILSLFGQALAAAPSHHGHKASGKERAQIEVGFKDLKHSNWAAGHIGKMKSKNIFTGYDDGTFRPERDVSRIEAIVTAVRLMGLEEEAKKRSTNTKLHFSDASSLDKDYKWAKGYVLVALENGLFDVSEDELKPGEASSRVWVASLLVKALGLQTQALEAMTDIPDFVDADAIPAGAVGYVNVAVERGIVTGYPDQTFRPHQKVTRAEMAAFLDRTNDGMLEEAGAIGVMGTIKNIHFESVTNQVYKNGTVIIHTFNNEPLVYTIKSDLLVQYHNRFITADQLRVNDTVALVVKEGKVLEATLLNKDDIELPIQGINELEIKLLGDKSHQYRLKYKNRNGKIHADIDNKLGKKKEKLKGEKAIASVEAIIAQLALTSETSKEDIIKRVLEVLGEKDYKKLEIEIKFSNGTKVDIDTKNKPKDKQKDKDKHKDKESDKGFLGIKEFELEIEFKSGDEVELEYKNKDGKVEAEIEKETKSGKEKVSGKAAIEELEALLTELSLTSEMSKDTILTIVLDKMNLNRATLKKLELEVKFTNGTDIEIEI